MIKIIKKIRNKVEWSFLLGLGESKLVASMYIWLLVVPVASKLLINIGDNADIIVFSHEFNVNLNLPFSWKVFYLAAVFFTFATLLFKFRCPKLIRDHKNFDSFSAEKRPEWHLMFYTEDIGLNFSEYKEKHKENRELYALIEPGTDTTGPITSDMFWELHRHSNHERAISYYSCLILYLAGLFCIAWVFIENLSWVLQSW